MSTDWAFEAAKASSVGWRQIFREEAETCDPDAKFRGPGS